MSDQPLQALFKHRDLIRRLARDLCADAEEARDVVQDAWAVALTSSERAREPKGWLAGVVRNLVRQRAREASRRRRREQAAARAEQIASSVEIVERSETIELLTRALQRLPESLRGVLILRYYEGLAPRHIATRTATPVSVVKGRLRRGLERLRHELDTLHGGRRDGWRGALLPLAAGRVVSGGALTTATALLVLTVGLVLTWEGTGTAGTDTLRDPEPGLRVVEEGNAGRTSELRAHAPEGGPRVLHGRALEAGTHRPVSGVSLTVSGLVTTSGPDGAFRVELQPGAETRVGVSAPAGYRVVPAEERTLKDGDDPLVILLERLAPPAQVILRDARTGEALPHFLFALGDGRAPSPVMTTDAQGAFELPPDSALPLHVHPREPGPSTWAAAPLEHAPSGLEARVAVGPTYHLAVDAPGAETGSLEARLVAADPRQAHRTAFAPIRAAPVGPWVRFGPETRLLEASGPWHLEVRERRGHGFGLAPVQRVVGIQPGLVAVRLETLGAVRGRVIDDRGRRVDQARVRLVPRDGTGEVREAVTTADGAFRVSWIVPGAYRVEVRSPLHATAHSDVVVLEGLTAALDLTPVALETMPVAGLLEGFGVATDGDDEVLLTLRSLSTPERTFLTRVPPATTADTPFEISDVPPGRYELTVHTEHFGRWDPSRLTVIAPAADLRIRRRRATETDVEFRVTSDQGEPVPAFSAFVRLDEKDDPATTKVCPGRNGRLLLRRLPLDASVAWVIRAPGAVPIRGRASAANLRGAPTEFQLEPGWGNRVRVLDEHGRPVPGVTITLDGVPAGVTDDHGVLDVLAERPPKRIGLGDPKLRVRAGDVFDDGTFRDLIWGIEVIAGEPGHATPPVKGDGR